jgi:hypothetical protein
MGITYTTRISTNCKMPTSMNTPLPKRELSLHIRLKPIYIGILWFRDERVGVIRMCCGGGMDVDVAAETAGS